MVNEDELYPTEPLPDHEATDSIDPSHDPLPVAPGWQAKGRRSLQRSLRNLIEWVAVAIGALAVALLIKAFLFQAFYIPSESMVHTLEVNDRVLVNKLSYRFGDPGRDDIVVFHKPPTAPGTIEDFIKRVIALPGETISFEAGAVFIDGERLDEPFTVGTTSAPSLAMNEPGCTAPVSTDRCTVADGYFFVMGDNRLNSTDSRVFGPIARDDIIGRAFIKIWPLSGFGFL